MFDEASSESNMGLGTLEKVEEEEALKKRKVIRVEDVLKLKRPTEDFICGDESKFDIDFTRFQIRDLETGKTIFEVKKTQRAEDEAANGDAEADEAQLSEGSNQGRCIRYKFIPQFLQLKSIGATVEFTVGKNPVHNFRMIERHYFGERLLKTFDFSFGFCIPNSKNTVEHIYEFPTLPENLRKQMIDRPYETKSDSFYFVNNELIMHNKAEYAYNATENSIEL